MIKTPKGCYDRDQEESILKNKIVDIIREVYEKYGFDPLETPILQRFEVLSKKGAGGREILNQTYNFKDKSGRHLGLRYDLTVSMARYAAENKNLTMPFKRYQISRVYRYEAVGKGHRREFWQADVDVIGSESMLADATCIACCYEALEKMGFENLAISLNNRKVLEALVKDAGVDGEDINEAFRAIDKLDKVGPGGVREELMEKGVGEKTADKVLEYIQIDGKGEARIEKAAEIVEDYKIGEEGIEELRDLIEYLEIWDIDYKVDLTLARGLAYYTGPIFETFIAGEEDLGSIASGGRYDNLIEIYSDRELPAVGISIGIERVLELIKKKDLIESEETLTEVFVANVSDGVLDKTLEVVRSLRDKGVRAEIDLRDRSLSNQLDYVNSKGIGLVVIVGERDLKNGEVTIKNMRKGEERKVDFESFLENPEELL